ncbi:MAG: ABC transporter permease [Anaerolineales bacterium]|jgi:peptide/nickel transport system permease protein
MGTYILRRIFLIIPVLLGISLLIFAIAKVTPGDPAAALAFPNTTPARIEFLRHQLGLDQPIYVQYGRFLWNAIHGDLGVSYRGSIPVLKALLDRLPNTLELTLAALAITIVAGIPLGVLAASNKNKLIDNTIMVTALTGLSIPSFYLGIILIIVFAVHLKLVSATGGPGLKNLILPAVALAAAPTAVMIRLTRASMLEVVSKDYVRTARAKGLKERIILVRHILRNSLIPIATFLGLLTGNLVVGAVFIEAVFARPGFGRFLVDAIIARDYPQVQGAVLFSACAFVGLNLLIDILYGIIDPRIRLEDKRVE